MAMEVERHPFPSFAGEGGAKRRMGYGPLKRTSPDCTRRTLFRAPMNDAGRASWRRSSCLTQRIPNALDDNRQPADDEFVTKSKNAKSRMSKPFIPPGVLDLRIGRLVGAAVRLDDDFSRKANEVREIRSNRRLPAKPVSVDLMIPHRAPKHSFGPRHVLTLRASEFARGLAETRWLVHLVYLSRAQLLPQLCRGRWRHRALSDARLLTGYGAKRHSFLPQPCWGRWREAPDGVWAAGANTRRLARSSAQTCSGRRPAFRTPSGASRHLPRFAEKGTPSRSAFVNV